MPERCADFRMGRCTRGSNCKFIHEESFDDRVPRDRDDRERDRDRSWERSVPRRAGRDDREIQMCGDYKNGRCTRGVNCKYSHAFDIDYSLKHGGDPPPPSPNACTLQGPYFHPQFGRYFFFNPATGQSDWAPDNYPPMGLPPMPYGGMYGGCGYSGYQADDREPCGDFRAGRCTRGSNCKFSHGGGMMASLYGAPPTDYGRPPSAYARPPPPPGYGRPAMDYGDDEWGRPPPDYGRPPMDNGENEMDFRRDDGREHGRDNGRAPTTSRNFREAPRGGVEMCGDFKRGVCKRGSACKFSHGDAELPPQSRDTREECQDFRRGNCTRGDACKFAHTGAPIECADFKRGNCTRDNCKYLHVGAEPERGRSRSRSRSRSCSYSRERRRRR